MGLIQRTNESMRFFTMKSKLDETPENCGFVRTGKNDQGKWVVLDYATNFGGILTKMEFVTDEIPSGDIIEKVILYFVDATDGKTDKLECNFNYTTASMLNTFARLGKDKELQGAEIELSIYKKNPKKDRVASISIRANGARSGWLYEKVDDLNKRNINISEVGKKVAFKNWKKLFEENILPEFDPNFSPDVKVVEATKTEKPSIVGREFNTNEAEDDADDFVGVTGAEINDDDLPF